MNLQSMPKYRSEKNYPIGTYIRTVNRRIDAGENEDAARMLLLLFRNFNIGAALFQSLAEKIENLTEKARHDFLYQLLIQIGLPEVEIIEFLELAKDQFRERLSNSLVDYLIAFSEKYKKQNNLENTFACFENAFGLRPENKEIKKKFVS